ncbi:hypothetical protein DIPPA_17533 [Diplonema papillatum]|nr:hypothetical protein DIPPA_17533 [Diplonema papillatum]
MFTILLVFQLFVQPCAKARDNVVAVGQLITQLCALLAASFSQYSAASRGSCLLLAGILLYVTLALVGVKLVVDVGSEIVVARTGRRKRLALLARGKRDGTENIPAPLTLEAKESFSEMRSMRASSENTECVDATRLGTTVLLPLLSTPSSPCSSNGEIGPVTPGSSVPGSFASGTTQQARLSRNTRKVPMLSPLQCCQSTDASFFGAELSPSNRHLSSRSRTARRPLDAGAAKSRA